MPYSLIFLEWNMHPGGGGPTHRFRDVRIDLVFAATKGHIGAPRNGDISAWDPVPKKIALPVGPPMLSSFTPVKATRGRNWSGGPTLGYDGIASIEATYSRERNLEVKYTDSCSIAGTIRYDERLSGKPNAVRFTFMENRAAETGVPPTARMAVLLKRSDWDTDGWFGMMVKIKSYVHWWKDGKETLKDAVGLKSRDDPVNFNPEDSYVVQDGENFERESANIKGVD